LGTYGALFGAPEFKVTLDGKVIAAIEVIRGAPCGATKEAARQMIGLFADEAAMRIGLGTQFFCVADPSGWDPIHGKSPVHYAGQRHANALRQAISNARKA